MAKRRDNQESTSAIDPEALKASITDPVLRSVITALSYARYHLSLGVYGRAASREAESITGEFADKVLMVLHYDGHLARDRCLLTRRTMSPSS